MKFRLWFVGSVRLSVLRDAVLLFVGSFHALDGLDLAHSSRHHSELLDVSPVDSDVRISLESLVAHVVPSAC